MHGSPRVYESWRMQPSTWPHMNSSAYRDANESPPPSVPCNRITSHGTFLSASTPKLRSPGNRTDLPLSEPDCWFFQPAC
jgi:hypothetical protein